MGERRGTKALELWCRRITEGYPGVNVQNMTTSWRDGLAFCAMIHHFRPDLIDFNSLNKDDVYGNNELAFRTAEQHLGIPALLDAEDMASCSVPDRLSILTYLSQFYQTFGGSSPSRLAMNRTTETADERIAPVPESPKPKVGSRLGMRRDPCAACGLPVFLAEKLVIARTPYHRTCFRCARCNNQLTPGNYYETEDGQYCCETCPDEVLSSMSSSMHQKYNEDIISATTRVNVQEDSSSEYRRSFSDEEKGRTADSSKNESGRILDSKSSKDSSRRLEFHDSTVPDLIAQTSQMRLNFMASHLLSERESEGTSVVDGSRIERSPSERNLQPEDRREATSRIVSALPDDDENEDVEEEDVEEASTSAGSTESLNEDDHPREPVEEHLRSVDVVNNALKDNLDIKSDEEQRLTAIPFHDLVKDSSVSLNNKVDDTKELLGKAEIRDGSDECLSLVQKRLRMFEIQDKKKDHVGKERSKKSASVVQETNVQSANQSDKMLEIHDKPSSRLDVPISRGISSQTESQKTDESTNDISPIIDRVPSASEGMPNNRKDASNEDNVSSMISNSDAERSECEKSSNGAIASTRWRNTLSPQISKESTSSHEVPINRESSMDGESPDSVKEASLTKAEGIDLSTSEDYPADLNPFKSDEEENATDKYHTAIDTSKTSTNPFDTDDEENDVGQIERDAVPPKPATRTTIGTNRVEQQSAVELPTKRRLVAPQINLNPFSSDDDEHDSDLESKDPSTPANAPVPKPRTIKNTSELGVAHRTLDLSRGDLYASNTSIASSESTPGGTYRKKKPAPPPPTAKELFPAGQHTSPVPKSFNTSVAYHSTSPRTTPRARKSKPAPPPPMPTSTPYNVTMGAPLNFVESPIIEPPPIDDNESLRMWEDQKTNKDETNRNRQSLTSVSCDESISYKTYTDKSIQGKWKRKKGPAPPRPTPHRRKIKVISMKDVKLELDEIELQQQGLEKQGVRLEQLIRDKCESGNNKTDDSSLSMDVEELVLELFALVNEKNELFRRQAELMLLRRQQRLEEEHAEVEYQIRCLMSQPEATKTDFDKQREESLIQRLVEIVERRNEIVECLEMDRRREVEEDRSIHKHMGLYAARNKNETSGNNNDTNNSSKTRKSKLKEKVKEKKSKKTPKKDADKDVDETEVKLKRHSKRKWF